MSVKIVISYPAKVKKDAIDHARLQASTFFPISPHAAAFLAPEHDEIIFINV